MKYYPILDIENKKDYLQELYDAMLEYTLPQLIDAFSYEFVHPSKFNTVIPLDDEHWTRVGNEYLRDIKDARMELSKSILENGMYFPFLMVKEDRCICEGTHRSVTLYHSDVPKNKKYLCLIVPEEVYRMHHDIFDKKKQVSYKIAKEYTDVHPNFLINMKEDIYTTKDMSSAIKMWNHYATWLAKQFYFYEQATGEMFKPARVNDMEDVFQAKVLTRKHQLFKLKKVKVKEKPKNRGNIKERRSRR